VWGICGITLSPSFDRLRMQGRGEGGAINE